MLILYLEDVYREYSLQIEWCFLPITEQIQAVPHYKYYTHHVDHLTNCAIFYKSKRQPWALTWSQLCLCLHWLCGAFLFQPYSGTTPNSFSSIMALVLPPEPMWNSSMSSTSHLTSSLSSNLPGSFLTSLSPLSFCLCLRRQIIYCSLLLTYWMPTAIWTIPPSILSHVRMPALPPGFTSASVLKMRLEGWTRRCQPSGNRILNLAVHPPAFVFSTSFFDISTRSNAIL